MNQKLLTRLSAALLSAVLMVGSAVSAGACTGVYVGSEVSENGSTYVGRSEDIGKLYDKVFEVRPAADHKEGEMYMDAYGFSMPYPAHTYRYTVMRDSIKAGESFYEEDGYQINEAYGEVGMNEKGVAVSATVSTANNAKLLQDGEWKKNKETGKYEWFDEGYLGYDPLVDTGLCEISLNTVILMQAESARDGVEKLAAILDEYGAGECNSFTISDANEVWDFETLSGHQYVAVRMPADKVSFNPNMVVMDEIDISDKENVVASSGLISLPQEKGFLVSSQLGTGVSEITKIDIAQTYGAKDFGKAQYQRYWQGVNYMNAKLAKEYSVVSNDDGSAGLSKPATLLFDADRKMSTYDVLRFLAYRGEGTDYDANKSGCYAIGNENQGECHIFEIRPDMPEDLTVIQWQTMSRAEFSVYLPFYSNLLTDTSEIFKCEYLPDVDDIEEVLDDAEFPDETSAYWVFAALNDLCDNDRDRYGVNVQKFWEAYQKELIKQQADVDAVMEKIYAYSPALAEKKATELGKAVAEEAFGCAKSMLNELQAFISEHGDDKEVFVPSVLTEGKLPTYSLSKFIDVPANAYYQSAVNWAVSNSVTGGVTETAFAPNAACTRAQAVTFLWRAAGSPAPKSSTMPFTDVAADAYYRNAVLWAVENGITKGSSDTTFSPNATCTRGQIVTFLWRSEKSPAAGTVSTFTDVAADAYCAGAVNWAVQQGITKGATDTTFGPNTNCTRAQIVTFLFRATAE